MFDIDWQEYMISLVKFAGKYEKNFHNYKFILFSVQKLSKLWP